MNLEKTNLNNTLTAGDHLFHIEIEGWKCDLGFCLDNKTIYVIMNNTTDDLEYKKVVMEAALNLIQQAGIYSDYDVRFYYDENFKITKLDE